MTMANEFELPESIRLAFAGKPWLGGAALAKALCMNTKTVSGHMNDGNLPYEEYGRGKVRPRRVSTLSQVATFLMNQQRNGKCQNENRAGTGFSSRRVRRAGTGGGNTKVTNLADRQARLLAIARGNSPSKNSQNESA
jgi:hypothetical protein